MSEHGGGADEAPRNNVPRSRLHDYAEMTAPPEAASSPEAEPTVRTEEAEPAVPAGEAEMAEARRREFAGLLGEFRRTPVLVPLGDGSGPDGQRGFLAADFYGVRFILAFSDEQALARYAMARGEASREWRYQRVLGARLLDAVVPAVGVPCGVALDCADGEDGVVFPPVCGIVPDAVAVDVDVEDVETGGGQ
ncbi:hypothetical protein [Streptomyces tricolor]